MRGNVRRAEAVRAIKIGFRRRRPEQLHKRFFLLRRTLKTPRFVVNVAIFLGPPVMVDCFENVSIYY